MGKLEGKVAFIIGAAANMLANLMPVEIIEAVDISNAIAFLVSDEGRYITGVTLPVDAGFTVR
jgi:NAD(P)-dependent dehydrogenase (short-subunit alcohol dehydrogenase family)